MKLMERENHEYFEQLLLALFDFMLMSGASIEILDRISSDALARAAKRLSPRRSGPSNDLAGAALVLDAWHRKSRYLDSYGRPKAIRLHGPPPSLEALIKQESPSANAKSVATQMKLLNLVVAVDKRLFVPIGPIARISAMHPMVQRHVAEAILNLLNTVRTNVSSNSSRARLLERFAEVPDLPVSELKEFQQFSEEQGWAFLRTINDWLESRRVSRRPGRKRSVRAGLHVFTYVAPKTTR